MGYTSFRIVDAGTDQECSAPRIDLRHAPAGPIAVGRPIFWVYSVYILVCENTRRSYVEHTDQDRPVDDVHQATRKTRIVRRRVVIAPHRTRRSIPPSLVPHRETVQCPVVALPLGHESIHQADEAGVVRRLKQVTQLVDHDVFEALTGLLGDGRY